MYISWLLNAFFYYRESKNVNAIGSVVVPEKKETKEGKKGWKKSRYNT